MTDKLEMWFTIETESPTIKDFHELRMEIYNKGLGYYEDNFEFGILMDKEQFHNFMSYIVNHFCLQEDHGIDIYYGFKIKLINNYSKELLKRWG